MTIFAREITTTGQLREEFIHAGRDNFSYDGYTALLDIIDSDNDSNPVLLDPIAVDSKFTEYESLDELRAAYSSHEDSFDGCELLEWFQGRTTVVPLDNGGVIVAEF